MPFHFFYPRLQAPSLQTFNAFSYLNGLRHSFSMPIAPSPMIYIAEYINVHNRRNSSLGPFPSLRRGASTDACVVGTLFSHLRLASYHYSKIITFFRPLKCLSFVNNFDFIDRAVAYITASML